MNRKVRSQKDKKKKENQHDKKELSEEEDKGGGWEKGEVRKAVQQQTMTVKINRMV